jgi:hypothetical protein
MDNTEENNVAVEFIRRLKALNEQTKFSEAEVKLIFNTFQQTSNMSPMEVLSLYDNAELAISEAQKDLSAEELEQIRKEILGE